MTDEEILALAKKHGMTTVHPPVRLVQDGDVLRWMQPPGLTPFGMSLLEFARDVQAAERERCAKLSPPAP